MKISRFSSLEDYLALVVRRKWWILIPFVAFSGLAILFARILPNFYVSDTMILIQPREVPDDFVKDLISGSTESRLSTIEQTILSRTNLLKIISQFDSSMVQYRGLNDERKVASLRKHVTIEFPSQRIQGQFVPITSIKISFRDPSPDLAQKITARLASLFIEQDSRTREDQVFGTNEFLMGELAKIMDQLNLSEDKLKVLKERYRYELPSELETNLRTLDRLQMQRNANLEALDRQLTMQLNLERQLSETAPTIVKDTIVRDGSPGSAVANPLVDTYHKKEQEYTELIAKATDRHPDVLRVLAELAQLRKEIPPQDLESVDKPVSSRTSLTIEVNPIYQSITAQLRQVKTEMEIREREKKWIETEMTKYNQRVQATPRAEQEIATAVRINEGLTKQADDLKSKLAQAKLAESLESKQKGDQFMIIDPASFPVEPAPPTRLAIVLCGLGVSLVLGLVVGLIVDIGNQRVFTGAELERLLKAPILVEIPQIVTLSEVRRVRKLRITQTFVFLVFTGIYSWGLYYLYLKQSVWLRLLDPLIERMRS